MKEIKIVFIVLSLWSMNGISQEKMERYTSDLGKFSIEYFGEIVENIREAEKSTSYKITFNSTSNNYLISASKHKSNLEDSIDRLLDVSITSFNKNVKGIMSNQKDIMLGNIKGKYALINLKDSNVKLDLYVYMNNNYQYQLIAYAEENIFNQTEVDEIINSFEIID